MSAIDPTLISSVRKLITSGGLAKAAPPSTFMQSSSPTTGLTNYDLEAAAKNLYPVLSPLRNIIPRVSGNGGTGPNFKTVTGIDTTNMFGGVSEGARAGVMSVSHADVYTAYKAIGLESSLTFEAELAAEGFDDLRARAAASLLEASMIGEERVILGGVGGSGGALGTCPTPVLVANASGGSIPTTTAVYVYCVALTSEGYLRTSSAGQVPNLVTRTNADGSTTTFGGGNSNLSAVATVTTAAANSSVTATLAAPPRNAVGYAWFVGAAAGTAYFYGYTAAAIITITSIPVSGQLASTVTADFSVNNLIYDGLLSYAGQAGYGAIWNTAVSGQGLTADGAGGIVEFDNILKQFWDTLRLGPDTMQVSSQEMMMLRRKILQQGSSASNARFTFLPNQGALVGSGMVKAYLNPFVMGGGPSEIKIELHPYLPPGTVLFMTSKLPYPMPNIANLMQIKLRRDYYQIDWPLTSRQYQYGIYCDGVLQHYFPPSLGVLTNLSAV